MIDPRNHPEFSWSVDSLVALRVLELLRADEPLVAYFRSIEAYEVEDFLTDGTLPTPGLGVVLRASDEDRSGSNHQARLEILVELLLISEHQSRSGTRQWLQARLINHIKAVLLATGGELLDEAGQPLTCALVQFQKDLTPRIIAGGNYLLKPVRIAFRSTINERTRLWS